MRRLLAIIFLLTSVLSVAIGVRSFWGSVYPTATACFITASEKGRHIFDTQTGKMLTLAPIPALSEPLPGNSPAHFGSRNGWIQIYNKRALNGMFVIYIENLGDSPRQVQSDARLHLAEWSPDEEFVIYLWSDSISKRYITIMNLQTGVAFTPSLQLPKTDGYFHWSADSKSVAYKVDTVSILIDPMLQTFRETSRTAKNQIAAYTTVISPTNKYAVFKSSEASWTIETLNGDYWNDYEIGVDKTSDVYASWSPDEHYLIFSFYSKFRPPTGPPPLSKAVFLELESGKIQEIKTDARFTPTFLGDGKTILLAEGLQGNTNLIARNLETSTNTVLFRGDLHGEIIPFRQSWVFVGGDRMGNSQHLYQLDISSGNLLILKTKLEREKFWFTANRRYFMLGSESNGEFTLTIYDSQGDQEIFSQPLPGKMRGIQGLLKDDWIAINMEQNGKLYGWFLDTKTHRLKELGEGRVVPASYTRFRSDNSSMVHERPMENQMVEYTIFDANLDIIGRYRLPKDNYIGLIERFITKDRRHVVAQHLDESGYGVWIASNDGTTTRLFVPQSPQRGTNHAARWTLDEEHIISLMQTIDSKTIPEIILFGIDGKVFWKRTLSQSSYSRPVAIPCRMDVVPSNY